MHLPLLKRKRSLLMNVGVIALLGVVLAACGGSGDTGASSSTASSCVPGSNTKLVTPKTVKKVGWSQNALDGAWRYAEEASIEQAAAAHGYQLLKTNANNSDVQQVQDIQNLINDRPDVLLIDPHTEDA